MSTVRENVKNKARARQKKRREEAQKGRAVQTAKKQAAQAQPGALAPVTAAEAASWPLGDCYASDNWHRQGETVYAVFTRVQSTGRIAAAFFELDLSDNGVVKAEFRADLIEPVLQGELVKRAQERAMLVVEPALVVKLVEAAEEHGLSEEVPQSPHLEEVEQLFGDVSPDACKFKILVGPPPEADTDEIPRGFIANLRRRLGL